MSDLLTDNDVQAFSEAMRSISDTFRKYPVNFDTIELKVGIKDITKGLREREGYSETDKAYLLSIDYDYLKEKNLIDSEGLLIVYDTPVTIDSERYSIINIKNGSVFRDKVMDIKIEVVR
ncbi:MAG: hypothetical protein GY714_10475 [Desulfobacterales bacterium]|nr:hypothetical protein [Desulfobacterales bacterium]